MLKKSRYGQTTYTEAENLHDLRSQFCTESTSPLKELNLKKEEFESEIIALEEAIEALNEFKVLFPDIQFKIEQLRKIKIKMIVGLKIKINSITSLIYYLLD